MSSLKWRVGECKVERVKRDAFESSRLRSRPPLCLYFIKSMRLSGFFTFLIFNDDLRQFSNWLLARWERRTFLLVIVPSTRSLFVPILTMQRTEKARNFFRRLEYVSTEYLHCTGRIFY